MPSISRQISGSSSTIRTSYAIRHLRRQNERGHGARAIGPVVQHQTSAMVFHDLLNDGEAESRALRLMRNIGFRQPRTIFLGQSNAVVGHDDANIIVDSLHGQSDRSAIYAG